MPRMVVGLGNPGTEYDGTRHNVGFAVIDCLARRHPNAGQSSFTKKFKGLFTQTQLGGETLFLLKPQTYMNLSGESVQPATAFYKLDAEQELMIVVDDLDLPVGKLRLRKFGSSGGHNGLKDIESRLGTQRYPRLRIGIGSPEGKDKGKNYVLSKGSADEQRQMGEAVETAADAIESWIADGIDKAMNRFNQSKEKEDA